MAVRSSLLFVSPMPGDKFVNVYKTTQSPFAREMIERLQAVYAIEAEIRGISAERRLSVRRTRSAPLMAALKARLTEMSTSSSAVEAGGGDQLRAQSLGRVDAVSSRRPRRGRQQYGRTNVPCARLA
nr:transposase [Bradyrhizobium cosmicum]